MRRKLRKSEVDVVGIDLIDVIMCRGSKDLDDLNQLVRSVVAWEQRLPQQQFTQHTPSRPDI